MNSNFSPKPANKKKNIMKVIVGLSNKVKGLTTAMVVGILAGVVILSLLSVTVIQAVKKKEQPIIVDPPIITDIDLSASKPVVDPKTGRLIKFDKITIEFHLPGSKEVEIKPK